MDAKAEELSAIIQEIRERVRARHPNGTAPGNVPLADLLPLLHARDAAEGKVASIGTVNPRAGGVVNSVIQKVKRLVARSLNWHVREQVEFNRAVMNCVQATIEAFSETNRTVAALAGQVHSRTNELENELRETRDLRGHWIQWRQHWEQKLGETEIQFLRSLSDLQGAWQHRVTLMDQQHREYMKSLHTEFQGSIDQAGAVLQQRFWGDLEKIRTEYEGIIHSELRLIRQKAQLTKTIAGLHPAPDPVTQVDWMKFAEKFRGTEEYVKRHLGIYVERFQGMANVLDVGCGRGELLELFRDAGIGARGIDLSDECVATSASKGLKVEKADLFPYLDGLPDASLDGVTCLQVVEHLPPARLPEFIALAHRKIRPGGLVAVETPNPECLAIFARHFYLDPTHAKPLPPALMAFYLEEAGFGRLETLRLEPAIESMPSIGSLPEDFRRDFFGSLDYAIFGRKLTLTRSSAT